MTSKPSYEELDQRVTELEKEAVGRKKAEEALSESEIQKRALDASVDRIRYVDKDMRIIWANKKTAIDLDMHPAELVGRVCFELFLGRDIPCDGCPTVKAGKTGQIERIIMHKTKANGIEQESYWDNYSVPLKNKAGDIEGFIQIARNITDQMRAEERIHTLSQQLIRAHESERRMISRELHDRVGQDLSTLKIGCETLFDNQPSVPIEIRQGVSGLSKSLEGIISTVRDLAYDLRPPSLDQLGLVQTVYQYCEEFSEKNGLGLDFFSAGMDDLRLDFDTEINLYRLIQEGLNNIKKHANASRMIIRLVASFPKIILRIEDDGKGFDVEGRLLRTSKEKRMGLGSMGERVSLLNGNLRIQSRLMEGTKILIEIPYGEKKNVSKEKHIDR
jgi:signal transduction histidine kinase